MKTLKENLKTVATYASADTTNAEGFAAWTPSDAALLEQLAMTGTLGNSFYANAKEAAKDAVALLERADAQALAAAIVRGRNEGFIRAFPILGLVYLSKKNAHLFQDAFKKVILTGNDLVDFIEVAKTVRGFGRSLKTAIADWIASNTNPYYAQKYRKQIADAIRLSRFKGEDSIYAYILNAYSDVKGNSAEKLEKAYAEYPDLAAHRDFVSAVEAGDLASAARILDARNLDVNSLTAYYGKFDKTLWVAVAKRSPVMRFVKYLAKFLREGVLTPELLKAKVNVEALKKAKVFSFRLYTAYLAVAREMSAEGKWALDHLADVMNAYAISTDWSVFAGKRWVIAPDVSGSMSSPIGTSSVLTYATVSAMFVGFFVKGLEILRTHLRDGERDVRGLLREGARERDCPAVGHGGEALPRAARRLGDDAHRRDHADGLWLHLHGSVREPHAREGHRHRLRRVPDGHDGVRHRLAHGVEEVPQAPSKGGCVRPPRRQLHDLSHPRDRGGEAERLPDLRLERLRHRLHEVRAGEADGYVVTVKATRMTCSRHVGNLNYEALR